MLVTTVRPARGLERITRHPFFSGLVLVMAAHVLLAPRLTEAVFFAGFIALVIAGTIHQARKLRLRYGAAAYDAYLESYAARRGSPPDRRYLEAHEGHMMYLKPGEEAFVRPDLIPALTLTGDAGAVRARVGALAAAGVDNLAVQVIPGLARELIEEFGREVIGRV